MRSDPRFTRSATSEIEGAPTWAVFPTCESVGCLVRYCLGQSLIDDEDQTSIGCATGDPDGERAVSGKNLEDIPVTRRGSSKAHAHQLGITFILDVVLHLLLGICRS